jgi:hypothetical protein
MNWDDAPAGTVTDLSYLNAKPAGINGALISKNGHFVESKTGQPIRLLGVNFTFEQNFPSHEDATKVAARLARLGFNIVRIHHHDWNDSPLWDKNSPGHQKFNAEALDKLDFLIAELKKQGIYVDLNLHVSRGFVPQDGFPDAVNQVPEHFSKRVDRFDRRMIELQKNFARDYLTHVNPYIGSSYTEDPCVAVVEINNENSMVGWSPAGAYYQKLPEPFRGDLIARWNDWLANHYRTDEALRTAWAPPEENAVAAGRDPLTADTQWFFEHRSEKATWTVQDIAGQRFPDIEVYSPKVAAQSFYLQPQINALNFEEGKLYAVAFSAKADKDRGIPVQASISGGDWHNIGLMALAPVTTEWRDYRYTFRADKPMENINRVMFQMGNDTGKMWLRNVRIEPADKPQYLQTFQSLKAKNFGLPSGSNPQESDDWTHFLTDTETAYSDEMRRYLREDLKVKANLTDTQMSFGTTTSFVREAGSDYADEHGYWQHPTFPGASWDPAHWEVEQTSITKMMGQGNRLEIFGMAYSRMSGKPYSISEFCEPAPLDFQSEGFPIMTSFAALQDWDAFYHFDMGNYGSSQPVPKIQSFFALSGNPAKEAFVPAAALLYRTGKMAPFQSVSTLKLSENTALKAGRFADEWRAANGNKPPEYWNSRLEVTLSPEAKENQVTKTLAGQPESSSLRFLHVMGGNQYVAEGQGAIAVAGSLGGQSVRTRNATFTFPAFGNNYAALILTSVQDPALETSRRLLLTIGGKAENLDMGWNANRTSVGTNWGSGPAQTEGIPATITLNNPRIKHVWALDPFGKRVQEVPVTTENGKATFTIGPSFRTMLYEISE